MGCIILNKCTRTYTHMFHAANLHRHIPDVMNECVCVLCCACVCVCVLVNKYVWGELIVVCVHLCVQIGCVICVYMCVCTCAGIWLHDTLYVPVNKCIYM